MLAHNTEWTMKKWKILRDAGLTEQQVRILMEYNVCGSVKISVPVKWTQHRHNKNNYNPLDVQKNASLNDASRLQEIAKEIGVQPEHLSLEQKSCLLASHEFNPKNQSIYEYDLRVLGEKINIARGKYQVEKVNGKWQVKTDSDGNFVENPNFSKETELITPQQAKELIRKGYLWKVEEALSFVQQYVVLAWDRQLSKVEQKKLWNVALKLEHMLSGIDWILPSMHYLFYGSKNGGLQSSTDMVWWTINKIANLSGFVDVVKPTALALKWMVWFSRLLQKIPSYSMALQVVKKWMHRDRVIENAKLSDTKRVNKALQYIEASLGQVIGVYDKDIIATAVLEAHTIGKWAIGKNGSQAEVYNYTWSQLKQKMQILSDVYQKLNSSSYKKIKFNEDTTWLDPHTPTVLTPKKWQAICVELIRSGICWDSVSEGGLRKTDVTGRSKENSIPENIQTKNSLNSDKLVDKAGNINTQAKAHIEKYLQTQGVLWKWQTLTEVQARKIYVVHNMERKAWETDDVALNRRKWIALRGLFTQEQIVVLLRGKVYGKMGDFFSWVKKYMIEEVFQKKKYTELTQIKDDLKSNFGIELSIDDVERLLIFTGKEQIENLKWVKDNLGIEIRSVYDIQELCSLTKDQVKNLKKIKEYFNIKIDISNFQELSQISKEQIENLREVKNLIGSEMSIVKVLSLAEVTNYQIENLKEVENTFDIEIDYFNVKQLCGLTKDQVKRLKKIKESFNIKVDMQNINTLLIKNKIQDIKEIWEYLKTKYNITENNQNNDIIRKLYRNVDYQLKNLKELEKEVEMFFGIGIISSIDIVELSQVTRDKVHSLRDIKDDLKNKLDIEIQDLFDIYQLPKLSKEQVDNLKEIKDNFDVEIDYSNIEKLSKIQRSKIDSFRKIKEYFEDNLNIEIDSKSICYLPDIITKDQVDYLKEVKDSFGLKLEPWDIQELSKVTEAQINKLKILKEKIRTLLGIEVISPWDIIDLSNITNEQINKVKKIKNTLKLDIIQSFDVEYLSNLTSNKINKVKEVKNILGIKVSVKDIDWLYELTKGQIKNLKRIKEYFNIEIDMRKFQELSHIPREQIENLKKIKKDLGVLGIKIDTFNIFELSKIDKNNLQKLVKDNIGNINQDNIVVASQLASQVNRKVFKKFISRKSEYLSENRILSQQRFDRLFGKWGKYGKSEINQTNLGYCYAYTGFEVLKKSNFFDTMIQTSLKKISWWWEVKVPLWHKNGKVIKVYESEINKEFTLIGNEKRRVKSININSNTSKWFKILEIAFIKEYILYNTKYDLNDLVKVARKQFEQTGNFEITWELLNILNWGTTGSFLSYMLWKDVVNSFRIESAIDKRNASEYIQNGLVKIEVSSHIKKVLIIKV